MNRVSRRGDILIEPYKQLRFGFTFLLLNLVFSSLILTVFGYFMWDVYVVIGEYFKLDESQSLASLEKFGKPAAIGVGLIVLFIVATLFMSAKYTHQIYGPLVSIRRFLDDLSAGRQPDPIRLRSSDQLKDLAEQINQLAGKVGEAKGGSSLGPIESFLDDLLANKTPQALKFDAEDPLHPIAERLNRLASR